MKKPQTKYELMNMIIVEMIMNGDECDLNHIDTSLITDMSFLFDSLNFNGNISNWNVSNVINMEFMFIKSLFNRDISQWNVKNVEKMNGMFSNSKINQDISEWNTKNIQECKGMFYKCNTPIPYWYSENAAEVRFKLKEREVNELSEKLEMKNDKKKLKI